ncbi:MAG: hemolysin III [Myxococcota bacterium]|jgi:hemolysin III
MTALTDRRMLRRADPDRPRLRGWLHGVATPIAIVIAVLLARRADVGVARASVVVFGVGLVGLYAVSTTYHLPPWPARVRAALARADVAMIQLFIAASFTPVAVHALDGAWRTWSLIIAWTVALGGAIVAASPISGPRWLGVTGYVAFGGFSLVPLVRSLGTLPAVGTVLLVLGAAVYAVGGVVYARRRPNPWPRWFGFHEVFHALVITASTIHIVAMWRYVIPLA